MSPTARAGSIGSRLRAVVERVPVAGPAAVAVARRARRAAGRGSAPPSGPLVEGHPGRFRIQPPAVVPDAPWPEPPPIDDPMRVLVTPWHRPETEPRFDIDRFEALNAEYRDRPLVADPPRYEEDAILERARARLLGVHRLIDLSGRRVLEFGCGGGFEIWSVAHHFGSDAWGVDVQERAAWTALADERVHLVRADLAVDRPFEADFFDRVVSFTTFEHVEHPHAALAELFRVMKPGGLAYVKANLFRGPMASHRYRDVFFPWPHLLFADDVFREFFRRQGLAVVGAAWVNRLSWAEYENHIRRVGFRIRMLRFSETPIDEAFYTRFEDVLGRYPRTDLARDFFEVVLEKPARR